MTDSFPDAILLAAGLGTRLRPLTATIPKPIIKVGGVPMLDRIVANAMAEGITRFAINIHHLPDVMEAYITGLGARFPKASLAISDERDLLRDTGGGAKKAMTVIESDPVFIMNTDAFWPPESDRPLNRMQDAFDEGDADIVLLCAHPVRAIGFRRSHDFCLAPDKKITPDRGLPVIYAGAALLGRKTLETAPEGPFSLLDLIYEAEGSGRLKGVLLDAPWLHVGDPQALEEAEAALAGARS